MALLEMVRVVVELMENVQMPAPQPAWMSRA